MISGYPPPVTSPTAPGNWISLSPVTSGTRQCTVAAALAVVFSGVMMPCWSLLVLVSSISTRSDRLQGMFGIGSGEMRPMLFCMGLLNRNVPVWMGKQNVPSGLVSEKCAKMC